MTTAMTATRLVLICAEVSMPCRFKSVNATAKATTHTTYGIPGKKFIANFPQRIVQMRGLSI